MHHTPWLCTRPLICHGKTAVALVGPLHSSVQRPHVVSRVRHRSGVSGRPLFHWSSRVSLFLVAAYTPSCSVQSRASCRRVVEGEPGGTFRFDITWQQGGHCDIKRVGEARAAAWAQLGCTRAGQQDFYLVTRLGANIQRLSGLAWMCTDGQPRRLLDPQSLRSLQVRTHTEKEVKPRS